MITRRTFSAAILTASASGQQKTNPRAIAMDGGTDSGCRIRQTWKDGRCTSTVTNGGNTPVQLREIVLLERSHNYSPRSAFYGEGFTMLSQTGGTLGQPKAIGGFLDSKHYRIPQPEGALTVYGAACVSPSANRHHLIAFTSARRFVGRFHFWPGKLQATLDCEGLTLQPGQTWELEEFTELQGESRAELFEQLGSMIATNHPPLRWAAPPEGWCSWYCFGPEVTAQQVRENLTWIAQNAPNLRYVQIDDGYQPAMGDWLETGSAFGGDVRAVLKDIKDRGFEPAIWVAPFIAEAASHVFRDHPEWFMKDAAGEPLPSNRVTFGGWRRGPWYALDATQPAVQDHLRKVFRTMNQDWGCTYFKLDANFWGAMHGGRLSDPHATRVEAYRLGMKAIIEGAGKSFILGCNHPVWASLGLLHGSRSSGDISRDWKTVRSVANENLHRAWQNGRLWWNDPDALVLLGSMPENEFMFHAAATFATGGMLLSGDDLTRMTPDREALLKRLRPTGKAATFDEELQVGRLRHGNREFAFTLNWSDQPQDMQFALARPARLRDLLTGEDLGLHSGHYRLKSMPRRSGRVFEILA